MYHFYYFYLAFLALQITLKTQLKLVLRALR